MDEYDDGYTDGQNAGWEDGLEYVKDEIRTEIKSVEAGDIDFETFVDRMKSISKSY